MSDLWQIPLMSTKEPTFTLGIEEEYLLVDQTTRALVAAPPDGLVEECDKAINPDVTGQVSPEFLRSQIEIGTKVCADISEARGELHMLRRAVSDVTAGMVWHRLPPAFIPLPIGVNSPIPTKSGTKSLPMICKWWGGVDDLRHACACRH